MLYGLRVFDDTTIRIYCGKGRRTVVPACVPVADPNLSLLPEDYLEHEASCPGGF